MASPSFFKEDLLKKIKDDDLKKKIVLATCGSVSPNAVDEVLKRDETKQVLRDDRVAKELKVVEELLKEISQEGLAVYGMAETRSAAEAGAIKTLLVSDGEIASQREAETFTGLESIMKVVDQTGGDVVIVTSEYAAGKKLDGLGGVAGLLRYQLQY